MFEIEYGNESKLLALLDSSENQKSEARIRRTDYLNETHCKSSKVSIAILLEVIEPIVTENFEIEYRLMKFNEKPKT